MGGGYSNTRHEAWLKYSAGNAVDCDIEHYSRGSYEKLLKNSDEKVVIIKGNIYESLIDYFCYHTPVFKSETLTMDVIVAGFPELKYDSIRRNSVEKWLKYIKNNPEKDLSEDNRFYWELRCGNWMSSINQALDILPNFKFVNPLNSHILASILLGYPHEERILKEHQKKITRYINPEIGAVPYGADLPVQDESFMEKAGRKISYSMDKFATYTKWYGFGTAVKCSIGKLSSKLR